MSNLATIVNNILADSGIDDINVVVTTGSYTNPAWIVSLPWTKITGTPTTLAGYGITDAYTQTQVNTLLNAKQNTLTLTTTGTSGAATLVGATLNIPQYQSVLTNPVTGTGSVGQVAYWSSGSVITGESVFIWDATNNRLGIGRTSPAYNLDVLGSGNFTGALLAGGDIRSVGIGSNTVVDGAFISLYDGATAKQMLHQLNASFGEDIWAYTGSAWNKVYTLSQSGEGTYSSSISAYNGEVIIQSATINNSWIGNNVVYDGNFKYRVNGYAQALYFDASDFEIRVADTGLTGNNITWRVGLRIYSVSGNVETPQDFTANKIIKAGGTTSQFLKANGDVDSNSYYLASNPSAFITLTSLSNVAPIQYNNTTGAISITQASGSTNGFLSSTDWNTFNNKTSNVGTVTSVAALTLGTTGTDLSSSVANSTTTPVITLNVPTASAANRGALSAADWTTFNNKQNALTNPVTGTGTTNYLPKFTGTSTIGNSLVFDNGVNIGIGTTSPTNFTPFGFGPNLEISGGAGGGFVSSNSDSSIKMIMQVSNSSNTGTLKTLTNHALTFATNDVTRMRLDTSGNLGLGVTPSAWATVSPVIEFTAGGFIGSQGSANTFYVGQNHYYNGTNFIYKQNGFATQYQVGSGLGNHQWYVAPSGTAGNAITFTQAMTLGTNSGLSIGTTSAAPSQGLLVQGAVTTGIFNQNTPVYFSTDGTDNSPALTIFKNTPTGTRQVFRVQSFFGDAGVVTVASINSAGAATFSSSVTVNGTIPATSGKLSVLTSTSTLGATADLGLLISNDGATGKLAQIGFGYSESRSAAVIGGVISNGAGATTSDLFFATRSTTTGSDAPTERMRITSGGNLEFKGSSSAANGDIRQLGFINTANSANVKAAIVAVNGADSDIMSLSFRTSTSSTNISQKLIIAGSGAATFSSSVSGTSAFFSAKSSFYNVYIGGTPSGDNYDTYSDSVVGVSNLHLGTRLNTGVLYINYVNSAPTIINYGGGNVGIGNITSASSLLHIQRSILGGGLGDGILLTMKNASTVNDTRSCISFGNISGIGGALAMQAAILKNSTTGEYDMTWDLYGGAASWQENLLYLDSNPGTVSIGTAGSQTTSTYAGRLSVHKAGSGANIVLGTGSNTNNAVMSRFVTYNSNNGNSGNEGVSQFYGITSIESALTTANSNASGNSGGYIMFKTKSDAGTLEERVRVTDIGNVLVNTTSTIVNNRMWVNLSGTEGFRAGTWETYSYTVNNAFIMENAYFDNNFKRRASGYAIALYSDAGSGFQVRMAGTGAAGSTISWVNAMQLNASYEAIFHSKVTATSFFESSDIRLKSNIKNYSPNGISEIVAKLYEKDGKLELGYIAQDLQGVLDSAISIRENEMLDLSYRQVHTAKIASLEKEVRELKEQLKNK
jgi:hypothetical protein